MPNILQKRAVKRRRSSNSDDTTDSADSISKPLSSNVSLVDKISFEIDIKNEPLDEGDGTEADQSTATGLEEDLIEAVKTEQEEDPLTDDGFKASRMLANTEGMFGDGLTELTEECCDDGFSPGSAENLPKINVFAVTEFLVSLPDYDKEQMRVLWGQPRDLIDDSIGYVQVRRKLTICTIKCVVASKTTKSHCTITFNEANGNVEAVYCDCHKPQCGHDITALIWLCGEKSGFYWLQPMVARNAETMTISAIFGFPENSRGNCNGVFKEFLKRCQEKHILNPILLKSYEEEITKTPFEENESATASFEGVGSIKVSFEGDENCKTSFEKVENLKASLHYLMGKFKKTCNGLDVQLFLNFCRANMIKENADTLEVMSPESKQELEYGRITDTILNDVTQAKDDEIENLVEMITLRSIKENVEASCHMIESLEKSLNKKIKKCGLLLSNTSPIFAASPYGTTDTQVVYIKYLEDEELYPRKIEPKYKACMQLQMYLAKKTSACFCVVHKSKRIDIMVVKYNPNRMLQLHDNATAFWQTHIFQCLAMKNEIDSDLTGNLA